MGVLVVLSHSLAPLNGTVVDAWIADAADANADADVAAAAAVADATVDDADAATALAVAAATSAIAAPVPLPLPPPPMIPPWPPVSPWPRLCLLVSIRMMPVVALLSSFVGSSRWSSRVESHRKKVPTTHVFVEPTIL